MADFNFRLISVSIKNMKNVFNGQIKIAKNSDSETDGYSADIVGIYGQNGSGKTTVIQVLNLFKKLAMGLPFWSDLNECISVNKESCQFTFDFLIDSPESKYKASYEISFKKSSDGNCNFEDEKLSFSRFDREGWTRTTPIFDCNYKNDTRIFEPRNRYEALVKSNKENAINLPVALKLAQERKTSLLFSEDFYKILEKSNDKEFFGLVSNLKKYAAEKLFVIQNSHNSIISLDVMPPAVLHSENNKKVIGDIALTLKEPMVTDVNTFNIVSSVMENMNVVIGALVPGLSIGVKSFGSQLMQNGQEGIKYELVSKRYDSDFPIRYESEGIKKLLSILSLIIAMYNDSSVCVAIDELDAGVFEVLSGSLLHTIEETGKGQLIFTSHNLRPLEVLDRKNIVFTTTNQNNRYIRLKNVKDANNLRDVYIRALNLGGTDEELTTEFREYDIRRALRKACKHGEN